MYAIAQHARAGPIIRARRAAPLAAAPKERDARTDVESDWSQRGASQCRCRPDVANRRSCRSVNVSTARAALVAGEVEVVHEEFEDGHMGINYRYDRSLGYLVPRLAR